MASLLLLAGCLSNNDVMNDDTTEKTTEMSTTTQTPNNKTGCMLCDAELEYLDSPRDLRCEICGNVYVSDVWCANHHYVCDSCHAGDAYELIASVCRRSKSKNPVEIAMGLMDHPSVHMHGPEHHVLVGSALLAAYHNAGGNIDLDSALREMRRRGQQVPGGVCGSWGSCGAAISTGMFMSIVTGNSPLKAQEWRLSNHCTSCALDKIAVHGGPRCCKRDSFLAIVEAVKQSKEALGVEMELPREVKCHYSHLNKNCLGKECPFN